MASPFQDGPAESTLNPDLCEKCRYPFDRWPETVAKCKSRSVGKVWKGSYCTDFPHYNWQQLKESAQKGCKLCALFGRTLDIEAKRNPSGTWEKFMNGMEKLTVMEAHTNFDENDDSTLYWVITVGLDWVNAMKTPIRLFWPLVAACQKGVALPLEHSTMGSTSLNLVRQWLADCNASHRNCNPTSHDLPTRLIEINGHCLRLRHSRNLAKDTRYASLSHCWGGLDLFNLTKERLEAFQNCILRKELCKTFNDAIFIAEQLDFKYLWIDSLCIIQDDKDDWRYEASTMATVYSNSSLNIAAASAKNGSVGCSFVRDNETLSIMRGRTVNLAGSGPHIVTYRGEYADAILNSPLSKRPWVQQERILAPRVIWFSRQGLFWECREALHDEQFQSKSPIHVLDKPFNRDMPSLLSGWPELVNNYTIGRLTYDTDKLIAVSGLAHKAQLMSGAEYAWGLWKDNLEGQLCWSIEDSSPPVTTSRTEDTRIPSWSWASVSGPVSLNAWGWTSRLHRGEAVIRIHHVHFASPLLFPLEHSTTRELRIHCKYLFSALESPKDSSGDPQLLVGKTPQPVSWEPRWDVVSEKPQGTFYCLVIWQKWLSETIDMRQYIGLMMAKEGGDGVRGRFKRLGIFARVELKSWETTHVIEDPEIMADRTMYEELIGGDEHGTPQYIITLI